MCRLIVSFSSSRLIVAYCFISWMCLTNGHVHQSTSLYRRRRTQSAHISLNTFEMAWLRTEAERMRRTLSGQVSAMIAAAIESSIKEAGEADG